MILRPGRLIGVDLARTVALLGMMATHVLEGYTASGDPTTIQWLAGGRASALFAVLAGLSLALISGGSTPQAGRDLGRTTAGLAARAVLIALIGLAVGGLETGLAIILTYYGVLFLLGLPFLRLRAVPLAVLAAAWVLIGPVVSHLVRPELPERVGGSPDFSRLSDPGPLLSEVLFTGTYPAVPWLAYLLAGMALGRMDLRGWRTPLRLAAWGAGLAVTATVVSRLCTADLGIRSALFPYQTLTHEQALTILARSLHGSPPTGGAWQWLLVVSPHSATPFDLAQTIGSALVVLGLALALVHVVPRPGKQVLAVLAGAGTIPLTAYTLHVVMKTQQVWPPERPDTYGWHVAIVLGLGAVFALTGRRGPLEWIVGWPGRALRQRSAPD